MTVLGTLSDLRLKLRRKIGYSNDSTLVTDDMLSDALADATFQVNKHWPKVSISYFTTVSDQNRYTPLVSPKRRLRKVWWKQSCRDTNNIPGWLEFEESVEFWTSYEDMGDPSNDVALTRYLNMLDRYAGKNAYVTDVNEVYLRPAPTDTGTKVYYSYSEPRFATAADVTDDNPQWVDAFWAWAAYTMHGMLSGGDNAITEAEGADGTRIKKEGYKAHAAQMKASYDLFVENLPMSRPRW
jgi:hypothetical protein